MRNFLLLLYISMFIIGCDVISKEQELFYVNDLNIFVKEKRDLLIYDKYSGEISKKIEIGNCLNSYIVSDYLIMYYNDRCEKLSLKTFDKKIYNHDISNNYDYYNEHLVIFKDSIIYYYNILSEENKKIEIPKEIDNDKVYINFYKGRELFSNHKKNIEHITNNKPILVIRNALIYFYDIEKDEYIEKTPLGIMGILSNSLKYKNSYYTLLANPNIFKLLCADRGEIIVNTLTQKRELIVIDKIQKNKDSFVFRIVNSNEIFVINLNEYYPLGSNYYYYSSIDNRNIYISIFRYKIKEKIDDWLLDDKTLYFIRKGKMKHEYLFNLDKY